MSRYNTGNPIDSNNAKDLDDNAKNVDQFTNSEQDTWVDRFGKTRATIAGIQNNALSKSKVSAEVSLASDQRVVTIAGFNASLSTYYIDGIRLSYPSHYTYADITTETITLDESAPSGSIIIATALDPTGTGVVASVDQLASLSAAELSSGLIEGQEYRIVDVGARVIVYPAGTTALVGDIVNASGQVLQLQPSDDGSFNVLWFGAKPGVASQDQAFESAAQHSLEFYQNALGVNQRGFVSVGAGNWYLDGDGTLSTEAVWLLYGAEFQLPTNYTSNNVDNISYLPGRVIKFNARGDGDVQIGATDLQWLQDIRDSILGTAALTVVSPSGKVGILAASRTSDKPSATEGTIPVKCYVWNDDETNIGVGYAQYKEAIRSPNAGTTFCEETNVTTYGNLQTIYPNQSIGNAAGVCANYWIGGPVGSGPLDGSATKVRTSAAMVFTGGSAENTGGELLGFDAIAVVLERSLETSPEREVWRVPLDTKYSYYSSGGVRRAYTNATQDGSSNGRYAVTIKSATNVELTYQFNGGDFRCTTDTAASIGSPLFRYEDGYFVNTPVGTSDRNEKEQETEIEQALKEAALEVKVLIKKWKWKAAVESKGDEARWHIGPIAQDVQQAFESRGIDPFEYGFLGFDEILDENESPTGEVRMNIRHTELQYLIMAAEV